ncbi:MAG: nucleotidyl transferase AbiEii/AbiGii toxin family protein [Bacilli bacterium]
MNSMQLKDKLKNISKEKNVDFNTLLRLYMYDRFIERLSVSEYKDNFILKGGFYLSTLFGVENRTTMDIDTAFKNANFNEETIVKMIKEIVSIEIDDNAKLSYLGISPIRDEDEYGGYRVDIQIEIDNIKEKFHIDIATGDPITPKEINYKYKPILGDRYVKLWAYNIETVLAEKIETILSRVELNGRMRDFYDIYLIYKKDWNNINLEHFRKAIEKTFYKREYYGEPLVALDLIMNSNILKDRWKSYQKRYDYASNIDFAEILICLEKIINVIVLEIV